MTQLRRAIERFDAINAQDQTTILRNGERRPKELDYAERMTYWLEKLAPDASDALRLAARSQHIKRWAIPRSRYPEGRQGYKQWRTELAKFHAETAGEVMREVGYDEQAITRVQSLLRKEKLKVDPDSQTLEDVACLVFLEDYFADFAKRYQGDEAKIVEIVRKTWIKMSDRGHAEALKLPLSAEAERIVKIALAG